MTTTTRRSLLTTTGGVALVGVTGGLSGAADRRGRDDIASAHTLDRWNHKVADFGTRLTGTRAHRRYVDWLGDQLERAGLDVHRDRLTFDRWVPRTWGLRIGGTDIPIAFYFPYSGETPAGGVTAPLVYLGASPVNAAAWSLAAGKIAVVEVATPAVPVASVFPETGRYAPDMRSPEDVMPEPGVTDIAAAPLLELARDAGVLGVVCIRTGVSDAFAKDQYSPFTTGYMGCPALWVGPTAGQTVRTQALLGATATFTLEATKTKDCATETLWAVLRGGADTKEAVVVNTHTDGPNVAEENGGLGLLALAQKYARLPRSKRGRSLIFVATTGHFQLPQFAIGDGQSASRWMADHPEHVNGKRHQVVAALTLEHLGCIEWLDNASTNTYASSRRKDVAYCFTTTDLMRQQYLAACRGTANNRTITAEPVIYVGEGHDFHAAGIATASLIPGMSYLVQAPPNGAIERIDPRYMRGQIRTFSNLIQRLDRHTAAEIGTPAF